MYSSILCKLVSSCYQTFFVYLKWLFLLVTSYRVTFSRIFFLTFHDKIYSFLKMRIIDMFEDAQMVITTLNFR